LLEAQHPEGTLIIPQVVEAGRLRLEEIQAQVRTVWGALVVTVLNHLLTEPQLIMLVEAAAELTQPVAEIEA